MPASKPGKSVLFSPGTSSCFLRLFQKPYVDRRRINFAPALASSFLKPTDEDPVASLDINKITKLKGKKKVKKKRNFGFSCLVLVLWPRPARMDFEEKCRKPT